MKEAKSDAALDEALDELYGSPFEHFIALRRELAVRLRGGGDAAGARVVSAAPKPSRTAWALNQVARHRADLMAHVVASWRAAAKASASADGATLRDGAQRYREAVAEAVREARSVLAKDSVSLSASQARRMTETLQAFVTDDSERQKLLRGRLTRDIAVDDPFAGLEIGPALASPPRPSRAPEPRPKDAEEEEKEARRNDELRRAREEKRRAIDEAKARIATLESSFAEARRAAAEAEEALGRAQTAVAKTRAAVERIESELTLERSRLAALPRSIGAFPPR